MDPQQQPAQNNLYARGYDRTMYRTGATGDNPILDAVNSDMNANNSASVEISPGSIGSGTSGAIINQGAGNLSSGQVTYDDGNEGYWLGVDSDQIAKISIGPSSGNHLTWDGNTLTIVGAVNVGSLNIPDTTTTASFHVDSSGNTWWGANVSAGITAAPASITNAGAAIFQNVSIGGTAVQYVITNSGIFSYGDGSDGAATCDGSTTVAGMTLSAGNYTLTRDVYFSALTLNSGVTIYTNGYRIFCSLSLSLTGTIDRSGPAGSPGGGGGNNTAGGAGSGGAGLAAGYLSAVPAGGTGGTGAQNSGSNHGTAGTGSIGLTNSLGSNGSSGGVGGAAADNNIASGGSGGTITASNVKLIANWHLATLLDISSSGSTVKFTSSGSGGGAGGGGNQVVNNGGGGGGGGGTAGGILPIYAKVITIASTGVISANGGNGGDGGAGTTAGGSSGGNSGSSGGGSGAGGNGGIIVLVYNTLTNAGSNNIQVNGGIAGIAGFGAGNKGLNGTAGSNGSAGVIYQFQLSL